MSWFARKHPRMDEYLRTHGRLPSLSQSAAEAAKTPVSNPSANTYGGNQHSKPWWALSDWMDSRTNYPTTFGSSRNPYISDEETILDGLLTVSLRRGDIIVVPAGMMDVVPEKYREMTIELEDSHGYAVIK